MALSVLAAVPASAVSPEGDSAEIPYYTHNYVISDSYSAQPVNAVYSVERVLNSGKLGIEAFSELNDVCTDKNGDIYILDGKGSRLIIIDGKSYTVKNEIKEITMPDGSRTRFEEAKGVYVHTDGRIYIADTKAGRVLVCNGSSCVNEILLPESSLIPDDFMYQPIKVTVDSAGYTYVLSDGSYYGAILYAPSGKFLGFYGANSVKNTVTQFIAKMWKKLTSTNAKRSASASRLPYQFTDLYADKDNFIYTATGKTSQTLQTGQIRQLSPGLYFIHTMGEIALSPIGLSMVNKLSPLRFASLMMGIWYLSTATANKFAGMLSGLYPEDGKVKSILGYQIATMYDFFMLFVIMSGVASLILFLLSKKLQKMMHGVE